MNDSFIRWAGEVSKQEYGNKQQEFLRALSDPTEGW